jgi:hypothetical protein
LITLIEVPTTISKPTVNNNHRMAFTNSSLGKVRNRLSSNCCRGTAGQGVVQRVMHTVLNRLDLAM